MASHNARFVRLETLDNAVDKLKQSITPADAIVFKSATVQDVWTAIREIQQEQRDRQSIRNLTRMKPLLDGLEKYSKTLDVLCNGTPYMPWIWAPIKLMLQLANSHHNIFEKLLQAYVRIGEALPRFDRFQDAFKDVPAFQAVLVRVFEDIVEFHRRVYKFFRRRAWHIFFESLWKDFDSRFDGLLESLKMGRDLIDQEAFAIDIVEARAWRQKAEADAQEREKRARIVQLQGAIAWLAVRGLQEDELDQLLQSICPGTADWITSHATVKSWMLDDEGEPILWLRGIPGGGKSVLSARIVQYLQDETDIATLYFFCNHYSNSNKQCSEVLRALISQLLRFNQDHALFVYTNYIQKASSMVQLRAALRDLLISLPHSRIVIDGLDECQEADRKAILGELSKLTAIPETSCKLLVSARDNTYAARPLRRMPTLCLTKEDASLNSDLKNYVKNTMDEILQEDRFQGKSVEGIEEDLLSRAQGMFLWVKVVMEEMKHCQCISDLRESVKNLPEGLHEVYKLILTRMKSELQGIRKDQAKRVFEWIAVSYRPLRMYEIQDGVSIRPGQTTLDEDTKLPDSVIDVCRPLVQRRSDGVIEFVHFSVKDFLLSEESGSFVNEVQAQRNITFSCVAYLATSLSLVSEHVPISERRRRILCGLHGLHHYAHAFWIEHFLRYAQLIGSLDTTDAEELLEQVRKLLAFKKADWIVRVAKNSVKVEPLEDDLARLSVLSTAPDVKSFVPQVLAFQRVLVQEDDRKSQKDLREYKLEHDPTYFTEILHFYQTTVELFLQPLDSNDLEGIDMARLKLFQSTFRPAAYVCRYRLCPRTCDGFPSPLEREEHEAIHINHLKCRDTSCSISPDVFPSRFALQKHKQKYHRIVEKPIPKLRLPVGTSSESVPEANMEGIR